MSSSYDVFEGEKCKAELSVVVAVNIKFIEEVVHTRFADAFRDK